ncbi:hypothetical protein K8I85_19370 [bacterium]|nr:hypothetical protein [bacterium]
MNPRFARTALAVLPFLLAAGCNNKDDSNPVGTGGGHDTGLVSGDLDVGVSALGAMDFANEFLTEVQSLAEADFSGVTLDLAPPTTDVGGGPWMPEEFPARLYIGGPGRTEDEVVWSDNDQAWVLDAEQTEQSTDGTATVALHFSVQYRTAEGTPQQLPNENTDEMTVTASFAVDLEGSSGQGDTFAMTMDYDMAMTVGGLPDGPYPVDGSGTLGMGLLWTVPDQPAVDVSMDMDWVMDMLVPADDSCPGGAMTMNIGTSEGDAFSFSASYDAPSGTADWTVYESGVAIDRGTEVLACGTPAS